MLTPDDLRSPLIEKILLSGPDAVATMVTPIKPITPARIRKYKKHVNKLIEIPRAEYFHKAKHAWLQDHRSISPCVNS